MNPIDVVDNALVHTGRLELLLETVGLQMVEDFVLDLVALLIAQAPSTLGFLDCLTVVGNQKVENDLESILRGFVEYAFSERGSSWSSTA